MDAPDPLAPPRSLSFFDGCLWVGLVCLILPLAWCGLVVAGEHRLRYRLTVEVTTPAGSRTGAGVIEARMDTNFFGDGARDFAGEAVAVDLPGGRTLFALPAWPGDGEEFAVAPPRIIGLANPGRLVDGRLETPDERLDRLRATGALAELVDERPLFVIFRDPDDRGSARAVTNGNIMSMLGPGYAIRRVTATATEEEISRGIEARLPWLRQDLDPPVRFVGGRLVPPEHALEARHLTR